MSRIRGLDYYVKEILFFDKELREDFVENFEEIIQKSEWYDAFLIGDLCYFKEIRDIVFKNLDLVFSKMEGVEHFANYMEGDEIAENIELFFKYVYNIDEIKELFRNIGTYNNSQLLLKMLAKYIRKMYVSMGFGGIYDLIRTIPGFINFDGENEDIKKLDIFFAENIDVIEEEMSPFMEFNFKYFMNMNKFKQEINKKGADFFVKFPLNCNISIEECRKIAESIFGEFTTENFTKMKFGYNNPQRALIFQILIDELLQQSKCKDMKDIEKIGEGYFSYVIKVGDYVIKHGISRNNKTIPNHRRILQSIVKTQIEVINEVGDGFFGFINECVEVQNLTDSKWYKNMDAKQVYEILYQIYKELRDEGLIWIDIKPSNVGRLLKANTSNVLYIDIDKKTKQIIPREDGNGLIGKVKGEPLSAGEYVIIDNDFIVKEEELENRQYSPPTLQIMKKFEDRYIKEKKRNDICK